MKAIALTEVATAAELNNVIGVVDNNADVLDALRKAVVILGFIGVGYAFADCISDRRFNREIENLKKRIDILEGKNDEEAEFFEE